MTFDIGERVYWKEYGQEHSGYLADTYEIETREGCMRMAYIAQSEAGAQYYWDWSHGKIKYAGNPLELEAVAYGALYKE